MDIIATLQIIGITVAVLGTIAAATFLGWLVWNLVAGAIEDHRAWKSYNRNH